MSADSPERTWWPHGAPQASPPARLICFPFAGGGASVYRGWRRASEPALEVCPVQLPGREGRIREAPFRRIEPLADLLVEVLRPRLFPPYAFFGCSMGAFVAFELAHRLAAAKLPTPRALFVAAAGPPPRRRCREPLHRLADDAFLTAVRNLDGTPDEALANAELMELVLPTLRADFELCETYESPERDPLPYPIIAFRGADDPSVTHDEVLGWEGLTRGGFRLVTLPGGHFLLESRSAELLRRVQDAMGLPRHGGTPAGGG
jgi:medium-chain acyl-[acyl-carrier-protein] hydrolase